MISGPGLRMLRTMRGMKQKTLARCLGISQPAYSRLEKCGLVPEEKMKRLLAVLQYNALDLEELRPYLPPAKTDHLKYEF